MSAKLTHAIDMLVYKLWFWRWQRKFKEQPHMLVPFMDTMTRWANKSMTPEEIELCRDKWRSIVNPQPKTMMENNDYEVSKHTLQFKCEWAVYPKNSGSSLCYVISEERGQVVVDALRDQAELAALKARLAVVEKPITLQDVRLIAGEGKLQPLHVLAAVNAILRDRAGKGRAE